MPRFRTLVLAAMALALVMTGSPRRVAARDGLPVAPDPSECTVEYTFDDLLAAVGTPPATAATPAPNEIEQTLADGVLPEGEEADEETVVAVTASVREAIACANTGNILRVFALLSQNYIARELAGGDPPTAEDAALFEATPPPLPDDEQLILYAVRAVTVLDDGRIGALVETDDPSGSPGISVDYFVFVEENGRYLIDQAVENVEEQFPPESDQGTPQA